MEEKQKFPTATGFSGKILIASLFILSGICCLPVIWDGLHLKSSI